jgi:hypothetical protein
MTGGLGRKSLLTGLAAAAGLAVLSSLLGSSPEVQTRLLASVAIGVIAGIGVSMFAAPPRASRVMLQVFLLALSVSVGLTATTPVDKFRMLMVHDFALSVQDREEFRRSSSGAYRAADEDLEVLRRNFVLPEPLYVFGDPVLLLRANRSQALPLHGWGPEFYDRRAWEELYSDLSSTSPPCIVVDDYAESVIRRRYPSIMRLITSRYEMWFYGSSGSWYVLGETATQD